jgi:hypothetical protein
MPGASVRGWEVSRLISFGRSSDNSGRLLMGVASAFSNPTVPFYPGASGCSPVTRSAVDALQTARPEGSYSVTV